MLQFLQQLAGTCSSKEHQPNCPHTLHVVENPTNTNRLVISDEGQLVNSYPGNDAYRTAAVWNITSVIHQGLIPYDKVDAVIGERIIAWSALSPSSTDLPDVDTPT